MQPCNLKKFNDNITKIQDQQPLILGRFFVPFSKCKKCISKMAVRSTFTHIPGSV